MTYKLDKKYLRRSKLKTTSIGLLFIVAGTAFTYSMVLDESWKLLFGVFFVYLGFKKLKELKCWEANSSKINLKIDLDIISVSDLNEVRSLKVESITKAVLQPIHGKIESIVIHSAGGGITKLEGFETMDEIASQLRDILGVSNVKTAKLFHR